MSVVNLADYRPSPRFDEEAWTQARIEQSDAEDGAWSALQTIVLDPVDADPENPLTRSFSAEYDSAGGEWFRVVFIDEDGDEEPTNPLQVTGPSYRPLVGDVAALIRTRTKPRDGQEYLGTFNENTTPTADQVESLISQAVGAVDGTVGPVSDALEARAGNVAAIYAAMLVELSYFPEQIDTDRSPYEKLKELYDQALSGLLAATLGNSPRKGIFSVPMRSAALSDDAVLS